VCLVLEGRVRVNGRAVLDPGSVAAPHDRILVDGKALSKKEKRYIVLNKPAGYVTTRHDERGRKTVYDLLDTRGGWVIPVGRLDRDSEGLLIFTNDTSFANRLTDPRYRVLRTYRAMVAGAIDSEDMERMRRGMDIGRGETAHTAKVKIIGQDHSSTWVEITLTEGKNREIRRLFEALGKPVMRLIRTRFGPFRLGALAPGEWENVPSEKLQV